jgi:transposase
MFLRKKKNKSGVISIQIIDKSSGKYKLIKTIGSSSSKIEIENLVKEGVLWIKNKIGQKQIDFTNEIDYAERFLDNIHQISIAGIELLLGKIFDEIGFNQIPDNLFRHLVLSRISFPASKLKTTDYLLKYQYLGVDVQQIYRYMDKLHKSQKEIVQNISYLHSLKTLGGTINIVFYDVTTLYFETDKPDELRKTGFSKEGKHQNPQILLGLLVSVDGYPLAYDIFEGNKYEGHTMLGVLENFKAKYKIEKLVVVADAGLLTSANINELIKSGYEFIIGAKIKSESKTIKEKILSLKLKHGESRIIKYEDKTRLIIGYSKQRATKDKHNRERGLQKIEKQIKSGKLTKSNINNRGYNKYLKLEGEVNITVNYEKFERDVIWDGLKGYRTNTQLTKGEIISNYSQLWKIEKAFRVSKHDLKIRPIFHRIQRRIEAHICISFTAYKVYKELERQLYEKKCNVSPEKAIEISKTIYSLKITTPSHGHEIVKTILITDEQKMLAGLFNF